MVLIMTDKEYSSPNYFASRLRDCLLSPSMFGVKAKQSGRNGEYVTFSIAGLDCKVRFEYRGAEPWAVHEFLDKEGEPLKAYEKRFTPKRSPAGRIGDESMDKELSGFLRKNIKEYGRSLRP